MKPFAIAAAVLALFSVSIAAAQRQEQAAPADEKVSGILSVLSVGDWIHLGGTEGRVVVSIRDVTRQEIADAVAVIDEYTKTRGANSGEFRQTMLKFGRSPQSDHYEVKELSSEFVTAKNYNSTRTVYIPSSGINYIVDETDEATDSD